MSDPNAPIWQQLDIVVRQARLTIDVFFESDAFRRYQDARRAAYAACAHLFELPQEDRPDE